MPKDTKKDTKQPDPGPDPRDTPKENLDVDTRQTTRDQKRNRRAEGQGGAISPSQFLRLHKRSHSGDEAVSGTVVLLYSIPSLASFIPLVLYTPDHLDGKTLVRGRATGGDVTGADFLIFVNGETAGSFAGGDGWVELDPGATMTAGAPIQVEPGGGSGNCLVYLELV